MTQSIKYVWLKLVTIWTLVTIHNYVLQPYQDVCSVLLPLSVQSAILLRIIYCQLILVKQNLDTIWMLHQYQCYVLKLVVRNALMRSVVLYAHLQIIISWIQQLETPVNVMMSIFSSPLLQYKHVFACQLTFCHQIPLVN